MRALRLLFVVLLFPVSIFAQTLDPPVRVDTNGGSWPHAVYDANDLLVVVYSGDHTNKGIHGKRYNSALQQIGPEFTASEADGHSHYYPKIGCFADGSYVVAWERLQTDPGYFTGVVFRRLDDLASPVSDVIEVPHYLQDGCAVVEVFTALDGSFEVFWSHACPGCYGTNYTPSYTFDALNNPLEHRNFQLYGYAASSARIAGNLNGTTAGVYAFNTGVYHQSSGVTLLRLLHSDISSGLSLDTEIFSDTTCSDIGVNYNHQYDVAMNALGEMVLVWENDTAIRFLRFDANGNPVGLPTQIGIAANAIGVALQDTGEFLFTWRGANGMILARHVAADNSMGSMLAIGDSQAFGSIAASPDGRFAISYHTSVLTEPNDWTPMTWVRQVRNPTTPVTFGSVTAVCENGAVTLRWDMVADEPVEQIRIDRSDQSGAPLVILPGESRGYTDTGVDPGRDYVYTVVATKAGGQEVESRPFSVSVPGASLELSQNEPNPFNPVTTIRYSLDKAALVTVDIYNALGQRVRSFEEGNRTVGWHHVTWDGRDTNGNEVASGLYLYVLQAGSKRISKKMTLVK